MKDKIGDSNPTRWTLILRAQGSGPEARAALNELIQRYDSYILWLVRRFGHPPDLTPHDCKQEYLAGILRRQDISNLADGRGSFRGWLNKSVRRHLSNEWNAWRAERSGRSKTTPIAFDVGHDWTAEDETATREFATQTVRHVLAQLRAEASDQKLLSRLLRFLPGPQFDLTELEPYARELGMSRTYLAQRICVLRARFRELLHTATADTLSAEPPKAPEPPGNGGAAPSRSIDAELRLLSRAFEGYRSTGVVLEPEPT